MLPFRPVRKPVVLVVHQSSDRSIERASEQTQHLHRRTLLSTVPNFFLKPVMPCNRALMLGDKPVGCEGDGDASGTMSSLPLECRRRCLAFGLGANDEDVLLLLLLLLLPALWQLLVREARSVGGLSRASGCGDGGGPSVTFEKAMKMSPVIGPSEGSPRARSGIHSLNWPVRWVSSSCTMCWPRNSTEVADICTTRTSERANE